jgi:hypothetical protein
MPPASVSASGCDCRFSQPVESRRRRCWRGEEGGRGRKDHRHTALRYTRTTPHSVSGAPPMTSRLCTPSGKSGQAGLAESHCEGRRREIRRNPVGIRQGSDRKLLAALLPAHCAPRCPLSSCAWLGCSVCPCVICQESTEKAGSPQLQMRCCYCCKPRSAPALDATHAQLQANDDIPWSEYRIQKGRRIYALDHGEPKKERQKGELKSDGAAILNGLRARWQCSWHKLCAAAREWSGEPPRRRLAVKSAPRRCVPGGNLLGVVLIRKAGCIPLAEC